MRLLSVGYEVGVVGMPCDLCKGVSVRYVRVSVSASVASVVPGTRESTLPEADGSEQGPSCLIVRTETCRAWVM